MNRPKTNKKTLAIGLGIIACISIVGIYRSHTVEKEGVYTIATLHNITGARGGVSYAFEYSYGGKNYDSFANSSEKKHSDEGKRFFIQVLPNDPERCKMTNIRVPDSITQAPYNGWKELPIPKK
ncbi:MAG: hypothetical protein RL662_2234 [Bacteroidota bacterium]|jgi:hypothetical protein